MEDSRTADLMNEKLKLTRKIKEDREDAKRQKQGYRGGGTHVLAAAKPPLSSLAILEVSDHDRREVLKQVDRKLVKQTVMTSVYGVTFIGARQQARAVAPPPLSSLLYSTKLSFLERFGALTWLRPSCCPLFFFFFFFFTRQIQNRLRERDHLSDLEASQYTRSNYAARQVLDALEDTFTNAKGVMNWLSDCARIGVRQFYGLPDRRGSHDEAVRKYVDTPPRPLQWTSPIGLPVVQPYSPRKKEIKTVKTVTQARDGNENDPICRAQSVTFRFSRRNSIEVLRLVSPCLPVRW